MKTFTKTLLAVELGAFAMCGAAEAALPYGYGSTSHGSSYGIAAGGCYVPATSSGYGSGYGSAYRPTTYGRSAFSEDRHHALPYPSTHRLVSYDRRGDDCGYDTPGRLPSKSSSYRDRYEDRYDGPPLFETWRPANASSRSDRRNW